MCGAGECENAAAVAKWWLCETPCFACGAKGGAALCGLSVRHKNASEIVYSVCGMRGDFSRKKTGASVAAGGMIVAAAKCFCCGAAIRGRVFQAMVVRVPAGGTSKESFCSVACMAGSPDTEAKFFAKRKLHTAQKKRHNTRKARMAGVLVE